MELVHWLITAAWDLFCMEFTIFGYTMSFAGIFLFSCVVVLVGELIDTFL